MKKERPGHEDKTKRKLNQHHEIDKDLDSPEVFMCNGRSNSQRAMLKFAWSCPTLGPTNSPSPRGAMPASRSSCDIAIPCNNKSPHSIGLLWWMLTRRVQRLRGIISRVMSVSTSTIADPGLSALGTKMYQRLKAFGTRRYLRSTSPELPCCNKG